ncbi:Cell cycle checkpoint protein RAD17 [Acorus calamus]|uniref:Cell cycle checkpoint protein RAD17 n=1 Tax=Acorus calamus TaxID=4465 RepID=A0AAV9F9Z3_ACOCL|nr:Cell cycle checkpoint protein RAD17 [Acorus calamus]
MGKRRVTIVLSSDENDNDDERDGMHHSSSKLGSGSRSKSRSSNRSKKNKTSKETTVSIEDSRMGSPKSGEINFDKLSEDFSSCLHGYNRVPGFGWSDGKELWVDKYEPCSLPELAVHKKKVEEVKIWLEERMQTSKEVYRNQTLVITGPAGVGKSATVHVIASHLGVELCEWKTPTPTLWKEHLHSANLGIRYMSKLDEFEAFIEHIRKYPVLPSASMGRSRKPIIILIDDLPVTNGRVACERLSKCLNALVRTTQVSTVILMTEYSKYDRGESTSHSGDEILTSLEKAGAHRVAFNPLTVNSIKKALSRICKDEKCDLNSYWIDHIAKASGGDIRHAITSLQYFCLRPELIPSSPVSSMTTTQLTGKSDKLNMFSNLSRDEDEFVANGLLPSFGRDQTLTLFHALGKFLHNKRETANASGVQDPFILKERFARLPLKMDDPEKILSQAHGQARPITDFLYENVLDFISDEAIEDAWVVASYLSDVDYLLSAMHPTRSWMNSDQHDLGNIIQSVAASVAARGVLYGNSQPSPSRWHSIRSPKLWQAEQSLRYNKNQLIADRYKVHNSHSPCGVIEMATEYQPTLKCLGFRAAKAVEVQRESIQGGRAEENDSDRMSSDDASEEDEIEDC